MLDSGMILKGEIRCWTLSGIEGLTTVHILYATPCICWQQYSVVEIVRKANKQMNRRQWNEGNCKLYYMIEKTSQNA